MMRFFVAIFLLVSHTTFSQSIDLGLPELSPRGYVRQVCGLTTISVDYGSPAVRGRSIWGELLPYQDIWRMGANSPTLIEFSHDVNIHGQLIIAGKYAMHAYLLSEFSTEVALSTNTSDWTDTTSEIIRFPVQLRTIPFTERLRFTVKDFSNSSAIVALQWEALELSFTVGLKTQEQVEERFTKILDPDWEVYAKAGEYALNILGNFKLSNNYINKAYSLNKNSTTAYLKGLYAFKVGKQKQAKSFLKESLTLGKNSGQDFFLENEINQLIERIQ